VISVKINGVRENLPENCSVMTLLRRKGLDSSLVVVQVNMEIINRSRLADVTLAEGDQVEIVKFLGGG